MTRYNYYDYFKPSQPIRTDEGIKAKSKRGAFVKNWWATRWIKTLEQVVNPGRLRRGRRYARQGQVLSIEETKKGIVAEVQGSRPRPYKVSLEIGRLNDAQWDAVLDVLANQAIFTAQLLAGEMPQEIEEAFATAEVTLFPKESQEIITKCSCPDPEELCKHVAAVYYILGEQFDEDPFLIFRLRGRTQAQILRALQERRATETDVADDADTDIEEDAVPLSETLASFWEMGQPLTHFKTTVKPPITQFPVLKRLGQPNFLNDDLIQTLGPAYQAISEAAIAAAFDEITTGEPKQK